MRKTTLALATFVALILLPRMVPALKNYVSLDPHDIPLVWDLPVPKPDAIETDQVRANRLVVRAPQNLIASHKTLDHFYAALLKAGLVRVLHYGDSPTTGDLDASKWAIDVAGDSPIKDGLHGLGGASFQGSSDAVANWTIKDGERTAEVAY